MGGRPLESRSFLRWVRCGLVGLTVASMIAMSLIATASTSRSSPNSGPLWVARYRGLGDDTAHWAALSSDGASLYVTGGILDYTTVAYDAMTGAQRWVAVYDGPANFADVAYSVAVSPDDATVYVTGHSFAYASSDDFATVAYDAASGEQQWVARYDGPASSDDEAFSIRVSPDGAKVYVTGYSYASASDSDYATVAYDAASGEQLWAARYNGTGNWTDIGLALAVSPDGLAVYVTGSSWSVADPDYATVGYDAATGAQLWAERFNGPGNGEDDGASLVVSPDSTTVYVTGGSWGLHDCFGVECIDYSTLAYATDSGSQLWVTEYNGPKDDYDYARSLAVSPDGATVYVTGDSWGVTSSDDYATLAYDAPTGGTRWTARFNGPGNVIDAARALAVSPDGATVFVTGESNESPYPASDYVTIAYDSQSGRPRGKVRFHGGRFPSSALVVLVAPDGSRFYVAGHAGPDSAKDFVTVAYAVP